MKTKLFLITCILVLFSAVQAQTPDAAKPVSWQQYKVSGEVFSVALPVLPAMHISSKIVEEVKERRRKEVLLGSYADGVVYVVYVLENPSPRQSLQGFIAEHMASQRGWNIDSERNISREGFSGKAFLSVEPGDGMIQFFSSEDRLYRFVAFGASPEDPRLTNFFSSVSFGKTKVALEVFEGPGLPYEHVAQGLGAPGLANDESTYKIYVGREVTRKARLAMKPEPRYTEDARKNQVTGTVVMKVVFASDGTVRNIRVVEGLPYGLTENAVQAAKRIKFLPAVKDGRFVSMWFQLEYNFNLY